MTKESITEKEWVHAGFKCEVVFTWQEYRCGYVAVPRDHPAYGKPYDSIPVDVENSLSYGCETKDIHWFGFICRHSWTLEEAVAETERLAEQFSNMTLRQIVRWHLRREPDWLLENIEIKGDE
ncbi:MAG: hypothetical protein HXS54_05915 [Theionarchaea archaeon]|nr:hypothetical protein [Theionarchaea archaeon]